MSKPLELLASSHGIEPSSLETLYAGGWQPSFDKNGSPYDTHRKRLLELTRQGAHEHEAIELWQHIKGMNEHSLLLYSQKQFRTGLIRNDFSSRMRHMLSYFDIPVDAAHPVMISLEHGISDPADVLPETAKVTIEAYAQEYKSLFSPYAEKRARLGTEGFSKLTVYGMVGQGVSMLGGVIGDAFQLFGNAFVEGMIRYVGGNGENVPYLYKFLKDRNASALEKELLAEHDECCHVPHEDEGLTDAEVFVRAKLIGALMPPVVDIAFRAAGVDIHAAGLGVIPAFFYPLADTLVSQIALWYYNCRREYKESHSMKESLVKGTRSYISKPSTWFGMGSVVLAYGAAFLGRALFYQDTTLFISSIESAAANLCVVTPLGTSAADYLWLQKPLNELTLRYEKEIKSSAGR